MGNTDSNPEKYADWERKSECCGNRSYYKVVELRWIRVPMCNVHATNSVEAARWMLTPAFAPLLDKTVKSDLSHECIEAVYTCDYCGTGNQMRFTAEILGKGNIRFVRGYYRTEKDARHEPAHGSMTEADVEKKVNKMGTDYDFFTNNCSHWCTRLWAKLRY